MQDEPTWIRDEDAQASAETYATLCIDGVDPDEVSRLLGVAATKTSLRGERINPANPRVTRVHATDRWWLESQGHVDSRVVANHVEWLCASVDPSGIATLHDLDAAMSVLVYWHHVDAHKVHNGPWLPDSMIQALAKLHLPINFDCYW